MSYTDELIERMKLEDELAVMAEPHEVSRRIQMVSEVYHKAIKDNDLPFADLANKVLDDLRKELEDAKRAVTDSACKVLSSSDGGNKKLFILER